MTTNFIRSTLNSKNEFRVNAEFINTWSIYVRRNKNI